MSQKSAWKLSNNSALTGRTLEDGEDGEGNERAAEVKINVDVGSPVAGAALSIIDDVVNLFALDEVGSDEVRIDQYCRGDDVVARFHSQASPFEREVCWRLLNYQSADEVDDSQTAIGSIGSIGSDTFSIELVYSIQTDALDLVPDPKVTSRLPMKSFKAYAVQGASTDDARIWKISDDLGVSQLLVATLSGGAKLAIGAFPSDLSVLEVDNSQFPCPVRFHIDSDFLEKGVIRRIRMFACCGPSDVDETELLRQATLFLNSPIPLTT